MTQISRHNPAFSGQIAKLFSLQKNDSFLDLTLGDGGHTQEALIAGANVISFDIDPISIKRASKFIPQKYLKHWTAINSNMTKVTEVITNRKLGPFKGILIDLGPSQYQVLSPSRGFSFFSNRPLDMRLDKKLGVTAKDLISALGQKELEKIFQLSDEPKSKQIAKAIVSQRKITPITTGKQLANLIQKIKGHPKKINPATQVFLALRMAVNLEREVIQTTLPQLPSLLMSGGILGVISFHSGEDRLVKQFAKQVSRDFQMSVIYKKPLQPDAEEINNNPRVRSAKLRLFKKND